MTTDEISWTKELLSAAGVSTGLDSVTTVPGDTLTVPRKPQPTFWQALRTLWQDAKRNVVVR